jgi:GNAT superfamily N-acetyltransferase
MQPADIPGVFALMDVAWGAPPPEFLPGREARVARPLESDPGGAWVAERDGDVVGAALAILRDGIWGLSLLIVREDLHGSGAGRALFDRSLAYADGSRGGIILSSEHPAAIRLYASAGFDLLPCVSLAGHVRTAPPAPPHVRDGDARDHGWIDEISVAVRGARYADDIPAMVATGQTLRCVEGRGFLLARGSEVKLAAAADEEAATWLLEDVLARAGGAKVDVDFLTSGQDWAIQAAVAAGLVLSPDGPVFVRGERGALRPWIPSGAYL